MQEKEKALNIEDTEVVNTEDEMTIAETEFSE